MTVSVFRFAPSPNGYLHLGHALSALVNFDMARAAGGRLLLRIEDIDATRCRPEYEAAIYEDLAWLGIAWEEPVRRQSAHLADYRAALTRLENQGLVYARPASRGRATPMARRSTRDTRTPCRPRNAPNGSRLGSPMRCVSTWRQRSPWSASLLGAKRAVARTARPAR